VLGLAATGSAGLTGNQLEDAPAWPGTPLISTTGSLNLQTDFNVEAEIPPLECEGTGGCNGAAAHTFVATTNFQLDKFIIRLAGAPTTGEIYLYPEPVGGTDGDGFVNVSFSTSLLNGGAGLPFTFNGTGTRTLMELDLTGADEIFLSAGTRYALDIRHTGFPTQVGSFYWMRAGNTMHLNDYLDGNIYVTTSQTQPGERYDVGSGRRDGALAIYGTPSAQGEPGDYNGDGSVDAADYVIWRKGVDGTLQNEVADPGVVSPADYDEWFERFGNPPAGGGGGVPEPAAGVMLILVACMAALVRRGR
jgi:hypothetical protein